MPASWTRRQWLALLGAAVGKPAVRRKPAWLEPEIASFLDSATEFPVRRLTAPQGDHQLAVPPCRSIARRGEFLVFSSNRSGSWQLYWLEWRSGRILQLTELANLDPEDYTLVPDDRACLCFDGSRLVRINLRDREIRTVYAIPPDWQRGKGLALSRDGRLLLVVEQGAGRHRLRIVEPKSGRARTWFEWDRPVRCPQLSPNSRQALFRDEAGRVWWLRAGAGSPQQLKLPPGRIGPVYWAPDSQSVVYLHMPEDPVRLNSIREYFPATDDDRLVAETTQFVDFSPNLDASVFVGASGMKASPYVFLVLRVNARELAICEHRASRPEQVRPVFSPDSRLLVFSSDREGRWCLYGVDVAAFVERTQPS